MSGLFGHSWQVVSSSLQMYLRLELVMHQCLFNLSHPIPVSGYYSPNSRWLMRIVSNAGCSDQFKGKIKLPLSTLCLITKKKPSSGIIIRDAGFTRSQSPQIFDVITEPSLQDLLGSSIKKGSTLQTKLSRGSAAALVVHTSSLSDLNTCTNRLHMSFKRILENIKAFSYFNIVTFHKIQSARSHQLGPTRRA